MFGTDFPPGNLGQRATRLRGAQVGHRQDWRLPRFPPGNLVQRTLVRTCSDICTKHAELLGLRFSTPKCAILHWGDTSALPDGEALTVQGKPLGVDLTTDPAYLSAHERGLREKALRSQNILTARILWSFNRVELRVHRCRLLVGDATRWKKRVRALAHKNEVPLPVLNTIKETSLSGKQLRERVVAAETRRWVDRAEAKPSLRLYASHKHTISQEHFYDSLPGSAMLFEARAGDDAEEVMCAVGGEEEETAEHIVLRCEQLNPHHPSDTTMAEALGFIAHPPPGGTLGTDDTTDASGAPPGWVTGDVAPVPVGTTKRRLEE
ncbi:hypothetical protein HPB48_008283 [Haemaphysalis longicornis]|uniref:Uncharacterized protein n=1 Tax=Haemaphysalis longicornis TaxID=44386 RepID=A0A9J6GP93_HAELO|nr:hypothetical protein HPB48_008283 [Haemaphysalis longicornis]